MTASWGSAYLLISLALTAHLSKAMVCQMGQEPDSNAAHRYRWVIPVEDPCKCTEIRPGGINTRTPGRNFKVIYFDTILISNSPKEIRQWLNCPDSSIPPNGEHTTTFATTDLPATIPQTPFTCEGKVDGRYSDPFNCEMYYECSHGIIYHRSCPYTLQFNQGAGQCLVENDGKCQS
ncbi:uncharacterized protein LOC117292775 [Asterias rubens]|uniref:uncharacterized protein LOC117292775 n=1 Tax=Asterias rubens TaxID=7604 RepID=UPI001454E85F|nr:uncharacterized protein LOC117292775 [Asterias rubens]